MQLFVNCASKHAICIFCSCGFSINVEKAAETKVAAQDSRSCLRPGETVVEGEFSPFHGLNMSIRLVGDSKLPPGVTECVLQGETPSLKTIFLKNVYCMVLILNQ